MKQRPETEATFVHPVLGTLRRIVPQEWHIPLPIGELPFTSRVIVATRQDAPESRLLDEAVAIVKSNASFRELVETHMYQAYCEDIQSCYVDAPVLSDSSAIWTVIINMNYVYFAFDVLDSSILTTTLSFSTVYDNEHEFVVEFRNRQIYEVMMDG